MSSVVSRKKGNIRDSSSDETAENDYFNTTDAEEGEPCLTSSSREKSKELTYPPAVTRIINYLSSLTLVDVNKFLAATVVLFLILITMAPAHAKKERNVMLAKQYVKATESLHQRYEYLQKTINGENDRLVDDMYEMVGLVQKEHYDEEVKTRDSAFNTMSNDFKAEVIKKQIKIDKLEAKILDYKQEMDKVNVIMADLDVKPENFCDACATEAGIGCKARRDYFQNHYKVPLVESMNIIVRQSPSCFKKDSNKAIPSEIAKEAAEENDVVELDADRHVKPEHFCNECQMSTFSSTCREKVNFWNSQYGTPIQEGMDAVVKKDSACFKKN